MSTTLAITYAGVNAFVCDTIPQYCYGTYAISAHYLMRFPYPMVTPVTDRIATLSNFGWGVGIDSSNTYVFVAINLAVGIIQRMTITGGTLSTWASSTIGLVSPTGLALDSNNYVWVASTGSGGTNGGMVYQLSGWSTASATTVSTWSGFSTPTGLAIDSQNNVYIANSGGVNAGYISIISAAGVLQLQWMGGFTSPYGLALDLTSQVLYLTTASTTQAISLLTQLVINNQVSNAYTNGLGIIVTPLYVVASASAMSTLYYTGSTCPVPLAPSNGGVGTCLSPMYQGSTCQMTCNAGYTLVGSATSCQAGVIIAQLCSLGCTVSAPLNRHWGPVVLHSIQVPHVDSHVILAIH